MILDMQTPTTAEYVLGAPATKCANTPHGPVTMTPIELTETSVTWAFHLGETPIGTAHRYYGHPFTVRDANGAHSETTPWTRARCATMLAARAEWLGFP